MATPTAASPRAVRSAVACFFSPSPKPVRELFVIGLFISFFFYPGGLRYGQGSWYFEWYSARTPRPLGAHRQNGLHGTKLKAWGLRVFPVVGRGRTRGLWQMPPGGRFDLTRV